MRAAIKQPLDCLIEEYGSREKWLEARLRGIGASSSSKAMGLSPYGNPYELWAELVGLVPPKDLSDSERIKWGMRLEPLIANAYEEEHPEHRLHDLGRYTICRSRAWSFLFCSLDRVIETPSGELGLLEIKTTAERNAWQWEEEPPIDYQVQLQHQLAVTGLQWGVIACLVGGQKLVPIRVERNDDFISFMVSELVKFWGLVESKEPPPMKGTPSREFMQRVWPREQPGKIVELPTRFDELDVAIAQAKAEKKSVEYRIEQLEAELCAAIKDGEAGVTPAGVIYSWKNAERKGYTVAPSSSRRLTRKGPPVELEQQLKKEVA